MHPNRFIWPATSTLLAILLTWGCGGGHKEPPVTPPSQPPKAAEATQAKSTSLRPWGFWRLHCVAGSDEAPAAVEAVPLRGGEVHLDVAWFLMPPNCINCMTIDIVDIKGTDWTLHVDLTNPTVFTAYDVKGIFPGEDGPDILAADSYTDLFDVDGSTNTHNPYVVFETGADDREWGPAETHGQDFTFGCEEGDKFVDLLYVVAASWPYNQDEVAELIDPVVSGPLYTDGSNEVDFTVEVLDWQFDVEYVLIDLEPLHGSAYTHMEPIGSGYYAVQSYSASGLDPGTETLLMAAKSLGSDYLTYNYVTVEMEESPPPPTNFAVFSGPTSLSGEGAPSGELDLAVVGLPDGSSTTLVHASSTEIYAWDETYATAGLFVTKTNPGGGDPNFPVEPVERIAVPDPPDPANPSEFAILQTNLDNDIWDDTTDPFILCRDTMQLLDLVNARVVDFKVTADNIETMELDAILRPMDVCCGVNSDKFGYALWALDGGAWPTYYPYVVLVRYKPPYKDETEEYDAIIGGVSTGPGEAELEPGDITGLAVWDGGGDAGIIIAVSEGEDTEEVEVFSADFAGDPGGMFLPLYTLTGFVGTPVDVAILPVGDAGVEDENWLLIPTAARTLEIYTLSGDFEESWFNTEALPCAPVHIDVDKENLRVHVMMEGPQMTVLEYTGDA